MEGAGTRKDPWGAWAEDGLAGKMAWPERLRDSLIYI